MKMLLAVILLSISTPSFADVISEDKAISIHSHACSAQAGLATSKFDKNLQVDFDDVFMEYNLSSSLLLQNGSAMVCKTSIAESGKVENVELTKVQAL